LEETYHLLCANPAEALPRAVREWADIYTHHATAAGQWIQMFIQAGRDSSSEKIRTPSQRLEEIFHAGDHKAMLAYINVLLAKCESQ
jgi:hypothetical protein